MFVDWTIQTAVKLRKLRTLGVSTVILVAVLYLILCTPAMSNFDARNFTNPRIALASDSSLTGISIADRIYVVSLKTRQDRRDEMDLLAERLNLRWVYVDAVSALDQLVQATLKWVHDAREFAAQQLSDEHYQSSSFKDPSISAESNTFAWPMSIDSLASSDEYLDYWDLTDHPNLNLPEHLFSTEYLKDIMPVATQNNTVISDASHLPDYMVLSPSRIACWHSHLSVIHRAANMPASGQTNASVTLILEDDVDMEQDINAQLSYLWNYLPTNWDIVFLGHCWSNESFYPSLSTLSGKQSVSVLPMPTHPINHTHRIHPSFSPKCTHAYALSRTGARRLLLYLRHPPFAYSRAIDQATAWLIQTKRLQSFSIVPSLIIQRKLLPSDVWANGNSMLLANGSRGVNGGMVAGSAWRERLSHGVLST